MTTHIDRNPVIVYRRVDGDDFLEHHGIKGMKWGVRRFQNANGSLTSAGKKRYSGNDAKMAEGGVPSGGGGGADDEEDEEDKLFKDDIQSVTNTPIGLVAVIVGKDGKKTTKIIPRSVAQKMGIKADGNLNEYKLRKAGKDVERTVKKFMKDAGNNLSSFGKFIDNKINPKKQGPQISKEQLQKNRHKSNVEKRKATARDKVIRDNQQLVPRAKQGPSISSKDLAKGKRSAAARSKVVQDNKSVPRSKQGPSADSKTLAKNKRSTAARSKVVRDNQSQFAPKIDKKKALRQNAVKQKAIRDQQSVPKINDPYQKAKKRKAATKAKAVRDQQSIPKKVKKKKTNVRNSLSM